MKTTKVLRASAVALALALTGGIATTANAADSTEIQILTINDFHGRIEQNPGGGEAGAAVIAGAVAQMRAAQPNTLFASAGDNIGASTFTSFIQKDEPTIAALVAAGLDVGTVGNHEFDRGWSDLQGRVIPHYGDSRYALGANVYYQGTTTPALDEYWISEVDGVRVGFVGVVTTDTAVMVSPAGIADIEFGDMLTAANRVANQLSDGDDANGEADVVILLAHDGNPVSSCADVTTSGTLFAELVVSASANIDAIVSGHTHQSYACQIPGPTGVDRPVIQAHNYGTTLGQLVFTVAVDGTIESSTANLIPLISDGTPAFPADPGVEADIASASAAAATLGSEPVGAINGDILRGGTAGSDRGVESSIGNLVADIQLWATTPASGYPGAPAQVAVMNPGGLRADLLYGMDGTMTYRDVASVQPFANTLVTLDLTGAQLRQVLEEQWQPEGSSRPKLHLGISGITYTYVEDAPRGQHIVQMFYNGEVIAPDQVFKVVTNSFLSAGGDNFFTLADGANHADTGQIDLDATVAYFRDSDGPVVPPVVGRAELLEAAVWAQLSLSADSVKQGGSIEAAVAGLTPGDEVTIATDLFTGDAVADADGVARITITVAADYPVGAVTVTATAPARDVLTASFTVVAAGQDPDPSESPDPSKSPKPEPDPSESPEAEDGDALPVSGARVPWQLVGSAALLLVAGGALLALRRSAVASSPHQS